MNVITTLSIEAVKKLPRESITLIVSLPPEENLAKLGEAAIQKQKWPVRIIVVDEEADKFSAMASADIGLAVNGQIVSECAVFQLPTVDNCY